MQDTNNKEAIIETPDEDKFLQASKKIGLLKTEIHKNIVGQESLIDMLIISFLADGHVLLEGLPGLAKTRTISTLSQAVDMEFSRIQFTPDLLPSDLIGAEIYNAKTGSFDIKKGPIFHNFILADEINRAPSKVQSALLEAMAEKHVTIGNDTFNLEKPFLVLATQNPIEQSGTYTLPEAQLDRFMFKINVDYPSRDEEQNMYKKVLAENNNGIGQVLSKMEIFELQKLAKEVYVSQNIYDYVSNIIEATRYPQDYKLQSVADYIAFGVSPRAGLALLSGAKARALMLGRSYVIPEDIKELATSALSHRIVLSYEGISSGIKIEDIVKKILSTIEVV